MGQVKLYKRGLFRRVDHHHWFCVSAGDYRLRDGLRTVAALGVDVNVPSRDAVTTRDAPVAEAQYMRERPVAELIDARLHVEVESQELFPPASAADTDRHMARSVESLSQRNPARSHPKNAHS